MKNKKKYTTIQRIKILESMFAKLWEAFKLQGEEIKKLKDEQTTNKRIN